MRVKLLEGCGCVPSKTAWGLLGFFLVGTPRSPNGAQ